VSWVVGQFHANSSGSASWIDHTLNINFKLTHYREPPSLDACLALAISENRPAEWTAGILRQCRAAVEEFHP